MSTEAFGSRRVNESLRAIANYLDEAAKVAGAITPSQVAKLNLVQTQSTQGPRLTHLIPNTASVTPGQAVDLDASAFGSHLANVEGFKLVRGAIDFTAKTITPHTHEDDGFTAHFANIAPLPGLYDAWVIDNLGRDFILNDVYTVEAPEESPATHALQLGGLLARQLSGTARQVSEVTVGAVLAVLRGGVSKAWIADADSCRLPKWEVKIVDEDDFEPADLLDEAKKLYKGIPIVLLHIRGPKAEDLLPVAYLVAESSAPVSEDRLVFSTVNPSSGS